MRFDAMEETVGAGKRNAREITKKKVLRIPAKMYLQARLHCGPPLGPCIAALCFQMHNLTI